MSEMLLHRFLARCREVGPRTDGQPDRDPLCFFPPIRALLAVGQVGDVNEFCSHREAPFPYFLHKKSLFRSERGTIVKNIVPLISQEP